MININDDNNDVDIGYCLSYNNDLGRVLIATKDYNVGDIVMKEKPLVVYNNLIELIHKVIQMNDQEKDLFYDMHHRDFQDNPPIFDECKNVMNELLDMFNSNDLHVFLNKSGISIDTAHKILMISNFNAHNFIGSNSSYNESSNLDEPKRTALFYLGSKVAHSCEPNCSYTSKIVNSTIDGDNDVLVYSAIKPIKAGDILSFSYINPRLSTVERRAILRREKDFFCECCKCSDYDYNSGLKCKLNGCKGYKYIIRPHRTSKGKWHCHLCNNEDEPVEFLHYEDDLRLQFENLVTKPGPFDIAIEKHMRLLSTASKFLSPTHYLVINIYLELSKIYATIANRFGNHELALQARLDAIVSHLKAFSLMECGDSKCDNGLDCMNIHQPDSHIPSYVLWSYMDIIHIINSKNKKFIQNIHFYIQKLEKYIPLLILEYGNKDPDVLAINSLYNEQYQNTINTSHKCRKKFCFKEGNKQCSKCKAHNVLFCSTDCFNYSWKYHRNNECKI